MKLHNLHTHTTYSDGDLTPERLIDELAKRGYEVMGITDHGFTRKTNSIRESNLQGYLDRLKVIQEKEMRLEVKLGLEVDLDIKTGTPPEELPFDQINKLDFILFEARGIDRNYLNFGINSIVRVRDKIKIPIGLAHYDYDNPHRFEKVCKILMENDIFFELNTGHGTGFLEDPFNIGKVAELFKRYNIPLTVGTDLHKLSSLDYSNGRRTPDYAFDFIRNNGLRSHKTVS